AHLVKTYLAGEVHLLKTGQGFFVVSRDPPMDHLDVQSRIGELVEADEAIEGLWMVFVNFLENLQRAFHLLRWRVVGNADVHGGFDVGPARNVGDGGIADRFVGNGDEVAVEIAYPRAAQADGLHDPINGIERDAVPDADWV